MRYALSIGLGLLLSVGSPCAAGGSTLGAANDNAKQETIRPKIVISGHKSVASREANAQVARAAARPAAAKAKSQAPAAQTKPFTILYDWAPTDDAAVKQMLESAGAQRYVMVYQNVDPAAAQTGKIDVAKIIAEVKQWHGPNPSGFGMLDYEVPFDKVLQAGPTHPLYETCSTEMVKAIKAVKQAFPNVKWTYYGIPGLSYWPGGELWVNASPAKQMAEIDRQITGYGPVMMECDWYSPCTYDIYRLASTAPAKQATQIKNEVAYRVGRVKVVKEFLARNNLPARPIIPSVSPFFAPGANATENALISQEEMLRDQVQPAFEAGADGIAIWSCSGFYIKQATLPNNPGNSTQKRTRDCYRADYLGGQEPSAWNTEQMKQNLNKFLGTAVANMAKAAKAEATLRSKEPVKAAAKTD